MVRLVIALHKQGKTIYTSWILPVFVHIWHLQQTSIKLYWGFLQILDPGSSKASKEPDANIHEQLLLHWCQMGRGLLWHKIPQWWKVFFFGWCWRVHSSHKFVKVGPCTCFPCDVQYNLRGDRLPKNWCFFLKKV